MILTEEQKAFVCRYTDQKYIDREKLIAYLESHELIESQVFKESSKIECEKGSLKVIEEGYDIVLSYSEVFRPISCCDFIRRIPFYYYIPKRAPYGPRLKSILPKRILLKQDELVLEQFYQDLEFIFYEVGLSLDTIFNYPVEQANTPRQYDGLSAIDIAIESAYKHEMYSSHEMFPQWVHYLKLCKALGWNDYTPDCFVAGYNYALEESGLEPIIYRPYSGHYYNFWREDRTYRCTGIFPYDKDGIPILRWTNIRVENPAYLSIDGEKSWESTLIIGLSPSTCIFAQGMDAIEYDEDEPVPEDEWRQIYAGPLTMEFDHESLKSARKEAGLKQKEIADAIGVSERTYQKWEYGKTVPDGYHLLRIMNWLDISDVQYFIKSKEPTT